MSISVFQNMGYALFLMVAVCLCIMQNRLSNINLYIFRVIVYRFKQKLRTWFVVLVSLLIVVISFIPNIINVSSGVYTQSRTIFIYNNTYSYSTCTKPIHDPGKMLVRNAIVWTLGIWFPMLLTLIVYVVMFCMITNNAKKMASSSTQDTGKTILRVSRKFMLILCAFYLCMLPGTIHSLYLYHLMSEGEFREVNTVLFGPVPHFTMAMMNFNSCINPLIYSGIHEKIYSAIMHLLSLLKLKLCSSSCCKQNDVEKNFSLNLLPPRKDQEPKHAEERVALKNI